MEEIIDAVVFEVENSGYMDKLSAGIVLTGGGAMLKHLPQLVKFKTGMDVRLGFPNEKLVADTKDDINQPMFSTSIGLLLKGYEYLKESGEKIRLNSAEAEEENLEEINNNQQKKGLAKGKIFESIRNAITDIFDEDDATM